MEGPRISVVLPVHNASLYLSQCLDSVLGQTESSIEVICVDDGSTDSSLSILQRYSQIDSRITVISQPASGAGSARNRGMSEAKGKYLSFLDADDFFELDMLKDAADALDRTEAEIVIFGSWVYDTKRDANRQASWTFVKDNIPKSEPFSVADMPGTIYNSFGNYTWNKLFRSDFISKNEISFQEISRTNDLLFVCSALTLASSIVTIDKCYVHYRVATESSLQSTNDKDPLAFFKAFTALKDFLQDSNLYSSVEQSFINHALDGVISNLKSLKSLKTVCELRKCVREQIEPTFHFLKYPKGYFYNSVQIEHYNQLVKDQPLTDYLFGRTKALHGEIDNLYWHIDWIEWRLWSTNEELDKRTSDIDLLASELEQIKEREYLTEKEINKIINSKSYIISQHIAKPFRIIRRLIRSINQG